MSVGTLHRDVKEKIPNKKYKEDDEDYYDKNEHVQYLLKIERENSRKGKVLYCTVQSVATVVFYNTRKHRNSLCIQYLAAT